ncbi:ATP-binding protein [Zavarzinella formosa]|uniref:ATP-binding protein n=1 Tax=Zavarzinella formosa TaxID=360055 RepID=UPI00059396B8|nr:ATP-binding protein [Zavarzinella formosa]
MIPSVLAAIAPDVLPNRRPARFFGCGFEVPLPRFDHVDQVLLDRIYQAVHGLPLRWRETEGSRDLAAMEDLIRQTAGPALLADALQLGRKTTAAGLEDEAIRKATHDIRSGGLTVLMGVAQMLAVSPGDEDLVRMAVDAARDHAKIMRNLLPDIDPAARADDEKAKAHGIAHFADKWSGCAVRQGEREAVVEVRNTFGGDISARCLETSSIDRVVYNYVNNAVRFAADGRVILWIFPVGTDLVRWVVQNRVDSDQAAFLASAAPDPARLFAGGVTRGGHGVGLANCAEIIAACFGLDSPAEAVTGGYLGAAMDGPEYLCWFHWPAIAA